MYYDTPALRFYWEKIDGLPFRRKLRIRCYGDAAGVSPTGTVHVEIKQRVNRVTQKRRLEMPYEQAGSLCGGSPTPFDDPLSQEIRGLVAGMSLMPTAIVGYQREALVGGLFDPGVRVTFDTRVRGRDRDLRFGASNAANRYVIDPSMAVLEVKVDDRVPSWITALVANHGLRTTRLSKYCRTIDVFGRAPRSLLYQPEEAVHNVGV